MVIFDENNKSIQIKLFLSKSTRVPHAKLYICKKVIFFDISRHEIYTPRPVEIDLLC